MSARQAQVKKTFYELYDEWMASCKTRVITGGRYASSKYSSQRSF
jgi:DNA gyrase inhibitor GyrI